MEGKFALEKLTLTRFAPVGIGFFSHPFEDVGAGEEAEFGLQHALSVDEEASSFLLFLRLESQIYLAHHPGPAVLHAVVVRYVYTYAGDIRSECFVEEVEALQISSVVHGLLLSIAYSTLRGMLPGLFAASSLRDLSLPIMSIENLLQIPMIDVWDMEMGLAIQVANRPERPRTSDEDPERTNPEAS